MGIYISVIYNNYIQSQYFTLNLKNGTNLLHLFIFRLKNGNKIFKKWLPK